MREDAKIFVAGHNGLVGSALIRKLEENGFCNVVVRSHSELDLTRQQDTEDFFSEEKPDYVFLAAAKVGGILANSTYKADFIYQNIMIASNVIQAAFKFGVKKLLNLGSSCIYPKFAEQPIKEDSLLTGLLEPTNEPYAIAKIAAIKLCRYFNEQYGTDFISVMPSNLYGLKDNFNLETSHVLPAILRKFHLAKLLEKSDFKGVVDDFLKHSDLPPGVDCSNIEAQLNLQYAINAKKVVLWGSGNPFREFLFSDDLADACLFLMRAKSFKDVGEVVNVGSGKDISLKALAALIKEVVGFNGSIEWNDKLPDGTPKKLTCANKMNKLGWQAKTELRSGVEKVYADYLR